MSTKRGELVNVYERCDSLEGGFKLIGSFVSAYFVRKAGEFLSISHSTVRKYKDTDEIFKDKYKFSSK